jgi:SulP family sulfate permease
VGISLTVIAVMVFLPKKWNNLIPASVLALILTTAAAALLNLDVRTIGTIPQTILLDDRLQPQGIPWHYAGELLAPAFSIAALCTIESLLCGTVGGRMVGQKLSLNQELIAQGVGNIVIPFFGGIPAAAVIARTSVAIRSGGRTRVVSLVHSLVLLMAALVLAPVIGKVPMSTLAGVLAVTAWRINDWPGIRSIFRRRFKSAILAFTATMLATVALDLTQAIIMGFALSALLFVFQISRIKVNLMQVSADMMRGQGYEMKTSAEHTVVINVMGPLFFGSASTFTDVIEGLGDVQDVILNLRFVPLLDMTGVGAIENAIALVETRGGRLHLNGLNEPVRSYLQRAGVLDYLGNDRIFWSTDQAIIAVDRRRAEQLNSPLPA